MITIIEVEYDNVDSQPCRLYLAAGANGVVTSGTDRLLPRIDFQVSGGTAPLDVTRWLARLFTHAASCTNVQKLAPQVTL